MYSLKICLNYMLLYADNEAVMSQKATNQDSSESEPRRTETLI